MGSIEGAEIRKPMLHSADRPHGARKQYFLQSPALCMEIQRPLFHSLPILGVHVQAPVRCMLHTPSRPQQPTQLRRCAPGQAADSLQ